MTDTSATSDLQPTLPIATRTWAMGAGGAACLGLSMLVAVPPLAAILWVAGAGALAGAIAVVLQARVAKAGTDAACRAVAAVAAVEVEREDGAALILTDAAGRTLWRNLVAAERLGLIQGGRVGSALADLVAAPDAVVRDLSAQASRGGTASRSAGGWTVAVRDAGGGRRLWRVSETLSDPAGEVPRLTLDPGGRVTGISRAAERLLGRAPGRLQDVLADPPLQDGGLHAVRTATGTEARRLHRVGDEVWMFPPGTAPAAPDAALLEALPLATLKIGAGGVVTLANQKACRLLDRDRLEGAPLPRLVEGLGRPIAEWIRDAQEGRYLDRTEVLKVAGVSPDRYLQVTLGRVSDGDAGDGSGTGTGPIDSNGTAVLAVLSDATEMKSLEAQFVQGQKMQAVGQLAGGIAHDFNNLLTAIGGHCDLLLLHREESDPDYADLQQIRHNSNRAAGLVGQLLAFSRRQPMTPDTIDVRNAMSDVAHLLNRLTGEKVRMVLDHGNDMAAIRADIRQLDQVMMNLVVNARDAMPDGGTVEIQTRRRRLTTPLVRDRAEVPVGDWVTISISDEGTGIPEDQLKKVFEPFFTTKKVGEGTGLGLSTVYGIVKQSGGFVFVDSRVGEGTRFTLWFPAEDPSSVSPADDAPAAAAAHPVLSGSVLLVEDEAPVRAFAARALRLRGLTVHEAASGEEALQILSAPGFEADVFVTDVIMPGLDGPAWVSEALKDRPSARVVFVSGYAEEGLAVRRDEVPASVFLPKPFTLGQLTETVAAQLALPGPGGH